MQLGKGGRLQVKGDRLLVAGTVQARGDRLVTGDKYYHSWGLIADKNRTFEQVEGRSVLEKDLGKGINS